MRRVVATEQSSAERPPSCNASSKSGTRVRYSTGSARHAASTASRDAAAVAVASSTHAGAAAGAPRGGRFSGAQSRSLSARSTASATRLPSGLNATEVTSSECPSSFATHSPVAASHTRTVLS